MPVFSFAICMLQSNVKVNMKKTTNNKVLPSEYVCIEKKVFLEEILTHKKHFSLYDVGFRNTINRAFEMYFFCDNARIKVEHVKHLGFIIRIYEVL